MSDHHEAQSDTISRLPLSILYYFLYGLPSMTKTCLMMNNYLCTKFQYLGWEYACFGVLYHHC